jgi:hypothetical protein
MYEELYTCSFKQKSFSKTPDECFKDITTQMGLNCTDDEITKLGMTYTSLGEFFESHLDDDGNETFFNYFDLICETDMILFENLHVKFIINVLSEMQNKPAYNLLHLIKIGCMALLGDNLARININKKYPSPFSKIFLLGMIEEQELSSARCVYEDR